MTSVNEKETEEAKSFPAFIISWQTSNRRTNFISRCFKIHYLWKTFLREYRGETPKLWNQGTLFCFLPHIRPENCDFSGAAGPSCGRTKSWQRILILKEKKNRRFSKKKLISNKILCDTCSEAINVAIIFEEEIWQLHEMHPYSMEIWGKYVSMQFSSWT